MTYICLFDLENPLEKAVRVDQAGEIGATQIYRGQIFALKYRKELGSERNELLEMLDGEEVHKLYFNKFMKQNRLKPSAFLPVWKKLSFFMGFVSSFLGADYASVCTKAIEDVIEKHYQEQIDNLTVLLDYISSDSELLNDFISKITQFRLDEMEHAKCADGLDLNSSQYRRFYYLIGAITKLAISITKTV